MSMSSLEGIFKAKSKGPVGNQTCNLLLRQASYPVKRKLSCSNCVWSLLITILKTLPLPASFSYWEQSIIGRSSPGKRWSPQCCALFRFGWAGYWAILFTLWFWHESLDQMTLEFPSPLVFYKTASAPCNKTHLAISLSATNFWSGRGDDGGKKNFWVFFR